MANAKKAYAYTLAVMLMSVVILSLASYAAQSLRQSRTDYVSLESGESLAYTADDIEEDIFSIVGTRLFAVRNSTHLSIIINDTSLFPQSPQPPIYLGSYQTYLSSIYYDKTNAIVNVSAGAFEQGGVVYSFSNPQGNYTHSSSNESHDVANLTVSTGGGTSLSAVRLVIYYCNYTRSGFTQMPGDGAGGINVSIEYTDLSGTLRQNLTIASGTYREFIVDYAIGNETLAFSIDTTGAGKVSSALLLPKGFSCTWAANYTFAQPIGAGEFVAVHPGISANYSQANGNYTKKVSNLTIGKT